ncbi:MAG: hypothetical protein KGZ57_07410 [Dethiobacter sp.]|nr:hypothetical protein [Dethiobacter sp.]
MQEILFKCQNIMTMEVFMLPAEKLTSVHDALSLVSDGAQLGLGGSPLTMNPVSLAANLILQETGNLKLVVAPIGGFVADLLIAAGSADSVEFAQLGFEELGMAPAFRQKTQAGEITVLDHT